MAGLFICSVALALNTSPLDNPFYYLENFRQVLGWIAQRYDDLLDASERRFITEFAGLPVPAQGLLVRMVMRKGVMFRASKLSYAEIGDPHQAVLPLLQQDWVDTSPPLGLSELFQLLRRDELSQCFKAHAVKGPERKHEWLERLQPLYETAQPLQQWHPLLPDAVFGLKIMPLCDRLRLLYFGNLYQEWSEFVLADLGIYRYEKVEFSADSRGINQRDDIDVCLQLHACREALETCVELHALAERAIAIECSNPWLNMRRAKLLYRIGQQAERLQDWPLALSVYRQSNYPGARSRQIRVLERNAEYAEAMALVEQAGLAPESDAEVQHLSRVTPRLQRKLGLTAARRPTARVVSRLDVQVTPSPGTSVERLIRLHLEEQQGGEVHYVENTLINSLFGLLCWRAIFAPLPGAFFHPFHSAPSDLYSPDFYQRRAVLFDECLLQLESNDYLLTIREHFQSKSGLQSPFVFWGSLTPQLLEQALHCLPADHLRLWFRRLLQDIKANRTGMPDLIQFFPEQRGYRMIEVKGPGDRLQDNQLRWLDFCAEHGMPVEVCYVQWAVEDPASETEHSPNLYGALCSS
ncbi:VRR-NUC domain-containing protein [Pseudomonas syringae]|uniref:VRR-NUC domain-containing protein n=1 Tax=Pseudomonas syringae TaxID=317 RepID=UPI00137318ED|nr:VRR-NUC domain-containing protein [Pseudomonas syringae]MDU8432771.1 VRR-NUC domain-containing protein [Pseudomonas syringae pv. actinidifoliorum]MDU8523875.1 VRR-NUC domain-containing protein [Pseudomonas syringae pv. actinidifoliorum]MDU8529750.1 VRR-NUC domain-containing protein [Pseudomonas syringae pv. actinidifoliorum]NAT25448.1 nuclease [Pseudomonas syringae pv. actinidifoliorum]NAT36692.1 nuclease [Pseudomonas syringae pv. actinidifoliorum]